MRRLLTALRPSAVLSAVLTVAFASLMAIRYGNFSPQDAAWSFLVVLALHRLLRPALRSTRRPYVAEFAAFLAFGPVAVAGAYWAQARYVHPVVWTAACMVGLLAAGMHAAEHDTQGWRGTALVLGAFAVPGIGILAGVLPLSGLLLFTALPRAARLARRGLKGTWPVGQALALEFNWALLLVVAVCTG